MAKVQTRFTATVNLAKGVDHLRRACRSELSRRRVMNSTSVVEVNYHYLQDLIQYFDDSREAAEAVVKARDNLHQIFFGL